MCTSYKINGINNEIKKCEEGTMIKASHNKKKFIFNDVTYREVNKYEENNSDKFFSLYWQLLA